MEEGHQRIVNAVESMEIMKKMKEFDESQENSPMFMVFRQYMRMVLEMLMFIRAVRTANWELHLKALEIFTKYFFAHDRLNYARMIPLYLAEMKALSNTDPEIYAELSGADNTGSFAGKGKATWWKAFQEASQDVITALANLGTSEQQSAETMAAIEKLICKLYVPKTTITTVKDLRWWLFKKKQAQSEKLPPTQAALQQTVTNYQVMIWNNDIVPQLQLPSLDNFGWKLEDNKWLPVDYFTASSRGCNPVGKMWLCEREMFDQQMPMS